MPNVGLSTVLHPNRVTTAGTAHHGIVTTSCVPCSLLQEPFNCCQTSSIFGRDLPLKGRLSDATMRLLIPGFCDENRDHYGDIRLNKIANGWVFTVNHKGKNGENQAELVTVAAGKGLHPPDGETPLTGTATLTNVSGTSTGDSPIILRFDDFLNNAIASGDTEGLQDAIHNTSIYHGAQSVVQAINAHVPLTEAPTCVFSCPPSSGSTLGNMFGRLLTASDALKMKEFFINSIVSNSGSNAYLKAHSIPPDIREMLMLSPTDKTPIRVARCMNGIVGYDIPKGKNIRRLIFICNAPDIDKASITSPDLQVYTIPPNDADLPLQLKADAATCTSHLDIPENENVQCILSRARSAYATESSDTDGHTLFGAMATAFQVSPLSLPQASCK